jgi:hypothetical protein
MAFVYHGVPTGMIGEVIYPLNQLAVIAPDAYELQRSKYLGREAVLDARISSAGLLFNDTVHCVPLHPYHLFAAREQLGLHPLLRARAEQGARTALAGCSSRSRWSGSRFIRFCGIAG